MRNWLIGTGLVIGGGVITIFLTALGFTRSTSVGIGIAVSVLGFAVQMYTAFSMKTSFERSFREKQRQHEALIKKAQTLPPEQAVQLLLGSAD